MNEKISGDGKMLGKDFSGHNVGFEVDQNVDYDNIELSPEQQARVDEMIAKDKNLPRGKAINIVLKQDEVSGEDNK